MLDAVLFLGLKVDSELEHKLLQVNPHLLGMLVDNRSDYLHEVSHGGERHLGKLLGKLEKVESLEMVEANIRSLLSKLLPEGNFELTPLTLFATVHSP